MSWAVVIDPYEGNPSLVGPFDTKEAAEDAAELIYQSGDFGVTVAGIYEAPTLK